MIWRTSGVQIHRLDFYLVTGQPGVGQHLLNQGVHAARRGVNPFQVIDSFRVRVGLECSSNRSMENPRMARSGARMSWEML